MSGKKNPCPYRLPAVTSVLSIQHNKTKQNKSTPLGVLFVLSVMSDGDLKPRTTEEVGGLERDCSRCEEKGARQGRK